MALEDNLLHTNLSSLKKNDEQIYKVNKSGLVWKYLEKICQVNFGKT